MTDSLKEMVRKQLRRDEGTVPHAYQDHLGYWTIGVGRLIDERKGGGLTDEEIDFLLENDINKRKAALFIQIPWIRDLSEPRLGVLLNMSFQMGVEGLLKFKTTLSLVKEGKYEEASKQMLNSLWAKQTPERAKRLAEQLKTNLWK